MTETANKNQLETVLTPILERLDNDITHSKELLELLHNQEIGKAQALVNSLLQDIATVSTEQQAILNQLEHSYTVEMLGNLEDTLEGIAHELSLLEKAKSECDTQDATYNDALEPAKCLEQAKFLCEFQLIPFYRVAKEAFYFWGRVDKDAELRKQYYEHEFAFNRQNYYVASGSELPYQATIVVVAYNHLDMTRQCVESVLENTDFERLNCELILVDHGSSDGTLEYFKSIPNAKVIHFKHNMRAAMFQILPMICRSPYYVHVANDIVVTKDWLDILLTCIKSDPQIAQVCPASPNVTNMQDDSVPKELDCAGIVEYAKQHNCSNPKLWFDNVRLIPVMAVFSMAALNKLGFWDPAIYSFEFADDDFSLHARRAGFRQVLCRDVVCYHKGSGTVNQDKYTEGTIFYGRDLFLKKNSIDAFTDGYCFNPKTIEALVKDLPVKQNFNILAINCGFGATPMQLCNALKHADKQPTLFQLVTSPSFLDDIKPWSDYVELVDISKLLTSIDSIWSDVEFDFILIDTLISNVQAAAYIAKSVYKRLTNGGKFWFNVSNPYYVETLQHNLQRYGSIKKQGEMSMSDLVNDMHTQFTSIDNLFNIGGQAKAGMVVDFIHKAKLGEPTNQNIGLLLISAHSMLAQKPL